MNFDRFGVVAGASCVLVMYGLMIKVISFEWCGDHLLAAKLPGGIDSNREQGRNGTDTATRVDWGIYNATVLLDMELIQNGQAGLTGGSFEFMSDGVDTGANRISDVILFIDRDGDKKPSAVEEVSEVMSGNVNVSGEAEAWTVTFDLTLEDGSTVTGNYTGSFHRASIQ